LKKRSRIRSLAPNTTEIGSAESLRVHVRRMLIC
jgi:hypothetical protein